MLSLTGRMISFHITASKRTGHPGTLHHHFVSLLMDKSVARIRRPRSAEPMCIIMMRSRRIHTARETIHNKQLAVLILQTIWKRRQNTICQNSKISLLWYFITLFSNNLRIVDNCKDKRMCRKVSEIRNCTHRAIVSNRTIVLTCCGRVDIMACTQPLGLFGSSR